MGLMRARGPYGVVGVVGAAGVMDIASDLALALDPVLFARSVGLNPDQWQADVLRSRASRALLNCCRQSGKSTIMGVLATHTAIYEPGSLVLLLCQARHGDVSTAQRMQRRLAWPRSLA